MRVPANGKRGDGAGLQPQPRKMASLIDLLYGLYETIPGLYEQKLSKSAVCRLFQPARTNSIDAKLYHRVIDAWVSKKIELGACIVGRHPFRQGAAETAAGMFYFSQATVCFWR